MQGVAPHVQKWLSETYGIKTINLSKQSTGLTYPGFFNWPQTIGNTLATNPQIKILVMFLGPNDPWDIPELGKLFFTSLFAVRRHAAIFRNWHR